MRLLLVSANTERLNMPTMPLGAAMVAAATRQAGHEVVFLDLMHEPEPLAALHAALGPERDLIGVSVRNVDDQEMSSPRFLLEPVRSVIEACRSCSDAPIVLGGAGYSIFPDAALAYLGADYGVCGEGEVALPRMLDLIASGRDPADLPGVRARGRPAATTQPFCADLDRLPLPDDELWAGFDPATRDLWFPVQARRGCPNECTYCSNSLVQGRSVRSRAPAAVARHVARVAQAGFRQIYFVDNTFNIPESYALELCRELRGLGVAWRCILYPRDVGEELVRALAEAGCVEVALGFESASEEILRWMNKRFLPDEVRRTSDMLAAHGIRRTGFLLFGAPGETRETVERSLAFAESLRLDALRTTVGVRIYPGTTLARVAVEQGVISADDDLLFPRFYLAPGLEPWIFERVTPGFRATGAR